MAGQSNLLLNRGCILPCLEQRPERVKWIYNSQVEESQKYPYSWDWWSQICSLLPITRLCLFAEAMSHSSRLSLCTWHIFGKAGKCVTLQMSGHKVWVATYLNRNPVSWCWRFLCKVLTNYSKWFFYCMEIQQVSDHPVLVLLPKPSALGL